jgi:transposase-like protein
LSAQYGISPKTVAKWRKRESVQDAPMGSSKPCSTVLTAEQEALVVAFRKHTLLPLDDCLDHVCMANGIEHRLTKINHPGPTDRVERMNRTLKEATAKKFFKASSSLRASFSGLRDRAVRSKSMESIFRRKVLTLHPSMRQSSV